MNNDDPFEREVKKTLEGMAREPAPDRLVARVAGIPDAESAAGGVGRGRPPFRGVVSGLAAIAAVVALAVAAVVLRQGALPQTGDASVSPTVDVPSSAPTPVPSMAMATLPPTTAPTRSPSTTSTPATPPVDGDAVPAGFRPMSVTFVSTSQGWVLGSAPCASGRCPAIAHTLDGGKTWTSIPAPAAKIADGPYVDSSFDAISGLRFADSRDGWAFGPELWATHDGGTTWKKQNVLSGAPIRALASSRGTVQVEVYDMTGEQGFRLASAPVASDQWTMSDLRIPPGAGPVPALQLVLSGGAGWVLENDRVVTDGARLVDGTWRAWDPPCLDTVGPAYIAASSVSDILATCDVGSWSTPEGGHLYVSHDGGATFQKTGPRLPFQIDQNVATPNTNTIVVGGSDTHETVIEASFDGGHTWAIVHRAGAVGLSDLGFTTDAQGVVIATAEGGSSHLLMTHDGGHTWAAVHF